VSTPVFIDSFYAADLLHVSQEAVLDLISEGRLQTYGGRASNPFLRSAEVIALAPSLPAPPDAEPPRRVKSATSRVRQRITADARWSDIAEDDIRDWARRTDAPARQAARTAAAGAIDKLNMLLRLLDEEC
jgi:hypothetical protein